MQKSSHNTELNKKVLYSTLLRINPGQLQMLHTHMKRIIQKTISLVTTASIAIVSSSCSFGVGSKQTVTVNSNVPAKIIANGTPVGKTPMSFEAKRAKSLSIIATAPGYTQSTKTISRQLSQTGMLDGVGGLFLLLPWLGLLS
ncbi:MAG: PEGA domain-containing protein, partial [Luteolibacter sp.]